MNPRISSTSRVLFLCVGILMVGLLTVTGCTTRKVGPTGPGNTYEVGGAPPASVTLMGVVRDQDGAPVSGAVVRLDDGQATITDAQGNYSFDGIDARQYGISVYRKGYTSSYRSTTASGDLADAGTIVIRPFDKVNGYSERDTRMDASGTVKELVRVETVSDGLDGRPSSAAVELPYGVRITDREGRPMDAAIPLSVAPLSIPEAPGLDSEVSDQATGTVERNFPVASAEFGPSGAVFDRPVTITIALPVSLSPGTELFLKFYNEQTGRWEEPVASDGTRILAKVNPNGRSASAGVSHFTTYGVLLQFTVVKPEQPTTVAISSIVRDILRGDSPDVDIQLGGTVSFTGTSSNDFRSIAKSFLEIEFGFSRGRLSDSGSLVPSRISFADPTISKVTVNILSELFSGVTVKLARKNPVTLVEVETIGQDVAKVNKTRLGLVEITKTIAAGHASGHASGHSSGGIHDSGIGF